MRDYKCLRLRLLILLTALGLIAGCAPGVQERTDAFPTSMPEKTAVQSMLTWERHLIEGCRTVTIDPHGLASFGPCSGPPSKGPILAEVERLRDFRHFLDLYQPFTADTPAGRLTFGGQGKEAATAAEKWALAEWASLVYQELQSGRSGASWGLGIAYNEEGSDPCCRIQLEIYGKLYANDCRSGIQPYPTGWLTAEQLDHLYAWTHEFQTFEMSRYENGLPMRLVFSGRGDEAPTQADQRAILTWVEELYEEVAR